MFKYQNGCKKSFYVSSAFDLYEYVERLEMAFDIIKPLYNSLQRLTSKNICGRLRMHLTVRAPVDLIVVAPRKNVFFHNSPKVVVGHGLKDYGVKNLFTM